MLLPIRRSWALAAALLLPFVAACEDEVTEPDAIVLAEEAEAVLRSAAELPTLPDLIQRQPPTGVAASDRSRLVLARAEEIWLEAAIEDDPGRAARRRRSAIALALPHLTERVEGTELKVIQDGLRGWMGMATGMLRHLDLPEVEEALDDAARYLARADVAAARGDHGTAVWLTLSAESRLLDTTPRVVARRLTRQAAAMLKTDPGDPLDDDVAIRTERLVAGAQQGLEEEDYLRAIQRAYYALQLLEAAREARR